MVKPSPAVFADSQALLAAWNVGSVIGTYEATSGSINATLIVQTTTGDYALRAYLRADTSGIAREHRLIHHAALRGVPAIAPISRTGGATTVERSGLHYALFPKARGQQHQRSALAPIEAAAMGRCLAELHLALADAPPRLARTRIHALDREGTLTTITRLLEQAADDELLVQHLQGQRMYLQSSDTQPINLSGLPHQIIHGDFTESNLFFEHDMVSAVIDWENSYVAPRAWEVARTLHLAFHFAPALCVAFVAGYRSLCRLTLSELDLTARAYAQMRAHDLWMIKAVLARGDSRPRRFLHPYGFQPALPHWIELRPYLNR